MERWTDPVVVSALVTGIATVALVVATIVLAIFTKKMADRASEPLVVATIEPNRWSLMHADIVVSNSGNATAFNTEIAFDPPLKRGSDDSQLAVPLQHVSVLKPGQSLRSHLGEFGPMMGASFRVTITWRRRSGGPLETMKYDLNMGTYDGYGHLGAGDPLIQIAEQLKKLREDWDGVARGKKRVQVDSYDKSDRQAESDARDTWLRQRRERNAQRRTGSEPEEH